MNSWPLVLELIHKLTVGMIFVVLVLTLVSFAGNHLYLELATHFRLQYLLASVVCVGVLFAFQSWRPLPIAIACAILNLVPILPYYSTPAHSASTDLINFKLLQANAFEQNRNYAEFLAEAKRLNPDVVVLQELTEEWETNTASLNQNYPFAVIEARPSGAGMAVFSRHPLVTKELLALDGSNHVSLRVEVEIEYTRVTLLALHPTTPVTPWKFKNRNKQFAEAAAIMKATKGPKLLVGDLNVTMWSPYFQRLLRDSGLRDARRGFGLQTTWPVPLPSFLRLAIDHCLVSEEWFVQGITTGANTGSDHKAILFELALPKETT